MQITWQQFRASQSHAKLEGQAQTLPIKVF